MAARNCVGRSTRWPLSPRGLGPPGGEASGDKTAAVTALFRLAMGSPLAVMLHLLESGLYLTFSDRSVGEACSVSMIEHTHIGMTGCCGTEWPAPTATNRPVAHAPSSKLSSDAPVEPQTVARR